MKAKKMINTKCHGCGLAMSFEAKPVVTTDMTGERITHYGKNTAPWICGTCREDPVKLRAARLACGLPASPNMPGGFDKDDEREVA